MIADRQIDKAFSDLDSQEVSMNTALPSLDNLRPNPAWAALPLFERTGWSRMAFGVIAESIGERAEPKDAQEEIYVGLEHLDPQCLHIRRWGKGSDVTGTKLRFRKGDIIFGRRRAYQRKLAMAEFDGICSAHAMVVRARPDKVLPEFLPFLMMSDRFMNRAVEISVGSLSPTINWTTLKLETFDLPPLDQQRRIAKILWAVDETSTKFEQTLSSIDEATRAASDSIFEANERTRHAKAADACDRITVGIVVKPASHYTDQPSGIPALRSLNVFPGRFDLSELVRLSPEGHKQNAKSELTAGDVVVVRTGRPGDAAVVSEVMSGMNLIDLILVRPKPGLLPEYLVEFLNSAYGKRRVYRGSAGTAQQHLNVTEFERIDLPLPSLADQRHAVAKIAAFKSPLLDTQEHLKKLSELQMTFINVLAT
jgi:type I restriction enzyme, S subunit